jgi:hypothetical protein
LIWRYRGVYNPFSKTTHPATERGGLALGVLSLTLYYCHPMSAKAASEYPKVFYGALAYTRLAINMLIYAWGSLVSKLSNEELEDVGKRIEDSVKAIRRI